MTGAPPRHIFTLQTLIEHLLYTQCVLSAGNKDHGQPWLLSFSLWVVSAQSSNSANLAKGEGGGEQGRRGGFLMH